MVSLRKRRYDSQRAVREAGYQDAGRARILCASPIWRCGRYWSARQLRLGYCPDCWAGGDTVSAAGTQSTAED